MDTNSHTLRRIVLSTGAVTILAGLGGASGTSNGLGTVARFKLPIGIAVNAPGSFALVVSGGDAAAAIAIFVFEFEVFSPFQADCGNNVVRYIMLSTGLVSTLAGTVGVTGAVNGLGTSALFNNPLGVAMDVAGTFALVVSSIGDCLGIRRIMIDTERM